MQTAFLLSILPQALLKAANSVEEKKLKDLEKLQKKIKYLSPEEAAALVITKLLITLCETLF